LRSNCYFDRHWFINRGLFENENLSDKVFLHSPCATGDIPECEIIKSCCFNAPIIDNDIFGNCVNSFYERRSADYKFYFAGIKRTDNILLYCSRDISMMDADAVSQRSCENPFFGKFAL